MTLHADQRRFALRLRDDDDVGDTRFARGIAIYRNTYRAQLVACLEESFARLRLWIGDEAMFAAMVAHIDRFPPSSWTLDAYARDFPDTVAAAYPDDPEVRELAWLDRALAEAFVSADAPTVAIGALADVDWDAATFVFVPSLDLVAASTNAGAIWSALVDEMPPPPAELLWETGALLVWRQDAMSRFRTIEGYEYRAILSARMGASFATLCTMLVAERGEADGMATAGAMLGRWLADGLIARIA